MAEKERAISILNGYIKKTMELDNVINKDVLDEFLAIVTDEYLQAYGKYDLKTLGALLEEQRGIRKALTSFLRNYESQEVVVYSKLVQTYNIFNKIFQKENDRYDFEKSMEAIERTYKHMWEVVEYLYKHSFVQHKALLEELKIPKSSLSDVMKVLVKAECVEGIRQGKYSFYNLTNSGRKYVRARRKGIDDEIIIDADSFRTGSQKITNSKMEFTEINSFKIPIRDMDRSKKEEKAIEVKWGREPLEYMSV